MAFRFSLQALLRLRRSLEKREQLRLETIIRELIQVRQQFEALGHENLVAGQLLAQAMTKGVSGAELHFEAACAAARTQRQEALRRKMAEIEQLRCRQQIVLQRARQEREILESLRRRQFELYRQIHARREQQLLDEIFLFGRGAPKAG